jgi:hypothetical protein
MKTTITETETGRTELTEYPDGSWAKHEYLGGNMVYYENPDGSWTKHEYLGGNMVRYENSNGKIVYIPSSSL